MVYVYVTVDRGFQEKGHKPANSPVCDTESGAEQGKRQENQISSTAMFATVGNRSHEPDLNNCLVQVQHQPPWAYGEIYFQHRGDAMVNVV